MSLQRRRNEVVRDVGASGSWLMSSQRRLDVDVGLPARRHRAASRARAVSSPIPRPDLVTATRFTLGRRLGTNWSEATCAVIAALG